LPDRIFAEIIAEDSDFAVDQTMVNAMTEQLANEEEIEEEEESHLLGRFFKKLFSLEKTKKGVVRVAYFGDSMIENDMMVHDLRKSYQDKYGGSGRGFVMLSKSYPSSGLSRFEYSSNWVTHKFIETTPIPVGVSGYVSVPKKGASTWTRWHHRPGSPSLTSPTLFYGQSGNKEAALTVVSDGDTAIFADLRTDELLNTQLLTSSSPTSLALKFSNADSIPFYGVNFADDNGIYIDNFPMLSSSGLPLMALEVELMNAFQQELGYDLLILQFGLNLLNPKDRATRQEYTQIMTDIVKRLRKCFPGADILVISSPDKARKYGTEMKTCNHLPSLLQAQERYAEDSKAEFINLFRLMGGAGSMIRWVDAGIANKDYSHFYTSGARKAAGLIFKHIEKEYESYKEENNLVEIEEVAE